MRKEHTHTHTHTHTHIYIYIYNVTQYQLAGSYEHRNEASCSIKGMEILH
jgi:hypothetical protein